jgi:tetratricopeptide (TPR) repeat protein
VKKQAKPPRLVLLALLILLIAIATIAAIAIWFSPSGRTWQQERWDDATLIGYTTQNPQDTSAQSVLAQRFEKNGALTEAIEAYKNIANAQQGKGKEAAKAYAKAALLALKQKLNPTEALQAAQNAVQADATETSAHEALGRVYLALGNTQGAQESFALVTQKDPKNATGWEGLAASLLGRKSYAEARGAARQATNLAPQNAAAWRTLGTIEQRLGNLQPAQESLQKALALGGTDATTYLELGRTLAAMPEKRDEALGALQKASEQTKNTPESYAPLLEIGNIFLAQHRFSEAQNAYQSALIVRPKDTAATFGLAQSLERQGKKAEAASLRKQFEQQSNYELQATHLQMRADRQPEQYTLLNELGALHASHQNWREAAMAWQKSLQINPNQPAISSKLAQAKKQLQQ